MIPTLALSYGPLTAEQLSPTSYLIRCLKNPHIPLGKFEWVCNIVVENTTGHVKGFLGLRKPRLSEIVSLFYLGGKMDLEELRWEHLDDEGNLEVEKRMKCKRIEKDD